jgi:phage baseplate assembly protein W
MSKEVLGTDLKLIDIELGSDLTLTPSGDIETISEEYNLGQAIANRLRTRQGELADLGHSRYGSHLYKLVGEPNNERTRELARIYTRESVAQDARVKEVVSVTVKSSKDDPRRIDIDISILPIRSSTVLNIVFPFYLEVV